MISETTVAVALGSNLGDRRAHLDFAVDTLRGRLGQLRVSAYHETEPLDVSPQPPFLNAAAVGTVDLDPRSLLDWLLDVERRRGRARPHPGAPRTLDLDLILFGAHVVDEPGLRVPHPRFRQRAFVLEPLSEIAPHFLDPETGLTIAALAARLAAPP
jgi:2-amino-4-hydroxy-6-hydroxymethyldihydropteridine diphosphokinase